MLDEALSRIKETAQKPTVGVGKVKYPGSLDGEKLKD
jgi:hypothetical protein